MEIKITQTFFSVSQGRIIQAGEVLNCSNALGNSIIQSKLGEEVATTKDLPIAPRVRRKKKRIVGKRVETAAVEIETT